MSLKAAAHPPQPFLAGSPTNGHPTARCASLDASAVSDDLIAKLLNETWADPLLLDVDLPFPHQHLHQHPTGAGATRQAQPQPHDALNASPAGAAAAAATSAVQHPAMLLGPPEVAGPEHSGWAYPHAMQHMGAPLLGETAPRFLPSMPLLLRCAHVLCLPCACHAAPQARFVAAQRLDVEGLLVPCNQVRNVCPCFHTVLHCLLLLCSHDPSETLLRCSLKLFSRTPGEACLGAAAPSPPAAASHGSISNTSYGRTHYLMLLPSAQSMRWPLGAGAGEVAQFASAAQAGDAVHRSTTGPRAQQPRLVLHSPVVDPFLGGPPPHPACHADDLSPMLRQQLQTMLGSALLEGCVRPGCTFLTIDAWVDKAACAALQPAVLAAQLLPTGALGPQSQRQSMLVQSKGVVAVVQRGRLLPTLMLPETASPLPQLHALSPIAAGLPEPAGNGVAPLEVTLFGQNLCPDSGCEVFCRGGGRFQATQPVEGRGGGDTTLVRALELAPGQHQPGCLEWEVQQGGVLSEARPLLLLPSAAAVEEVRQLESDATGFPDVPAFLREVGAVLRFGTGADAARVGARQRRLVGHLAQRCAAAAAARGWPALLALLLPAVRAGGVSAPEAAAGMDAAVPSGEWSSWLCRGLQGWWCLPSRHAIQHCILLCPLPSMLSLLRVRMSLDAPLSALPLALPLRLVIAAGGSMLHAAISSGSARSVDVLAAWGRLNGHSWRLGATTSPETGGLTPMHLLPLLPREQRAEVAAVTVGIEPQVAFCLWCDARSTQGATPADLARQVRQDHKIRCSCCNCVPASCVLCL